MRLVTQLANDDDVTRSLKHADKLDQLIEPERNFESSNFLTENNMAAVFPVLTTSSSVDATRNKFISCSGPQRIAEQPVDALEAGCMVPNNGVAFKDPPTSIYSQDGSNHLLQRNIISMLQPDHQSNSSERRDYQKQDCANSAERVDSSKEIFSSGFKDTVVTAFVEQRKYNTNDAQDKLVPGCVKDCSSVTSENQKSREDNVSSRKLLQNSVCNSKFIAETNSSTSFKYSLTPDGMPPPTRTNATVHATPDTDDPTTFERNTLMKQKNIKDTRNVPDLSASPQPITVSHSVNSPVVANTECEQTLIQKTNSPVEVATGDDFITSEIMSRSPEPARKGASGTVGPNGSGKEKKGLSARISKRFMNLFQKQPTNYPTILESAHTESQGGNSKVSGKKDHVKKATREGSLTGRLLMSVSDWRRKPANPVKDGSRNRKKKDADFEDTKEPQNNNTGRVPLFVSPQDQVEIVEDAPVGIRQEQKIILRESWLMIKSDVEEVGVETFMGLFHTHPDSIESFMAFKDKAVEDIEQSAVLKAHALRVMQTVDKCITRLDDVDKMATILCQLGKRHIGYKANASLVPMIGKQFISSIEPKMAEKWSDEVCKSWDCLFSIINYNLRRGMMQEKHRLQDDPATKKNK